VAGESVVLKPYAGVGIPVVPGYVGQSSETRGEPRIPDALAKGLWTPLVQRPAVISIIIAVVASPAFSVVVVARAIVTMVVYALILSTGLDGVLRVTVGPESALDCRRRSPAPFTMLLMLRGRWVRAMRGWHSCSPVLRTLARSRAFRLLCRHRLE
jgi:hypothetical protein